MELRMALGKKCRPQKSSAGLQGAARRKKKLIKKFEAEERARERFRLKWPDIAATFDQIRVDAAVFQEPRFEYALRDQMENVFELWSRLNPKERRFVLRDLNKVYPTKSESTPYLAVMKAASIPGYNP